MYIEEWEWDDGNLDELARHGLARRHVEQVAEESPRFRRNKRGRAATHQMIGPDFGGAVWVGRMGCLHRSDRWRTGQMARYYRLASG